MSNKASDGSLPVVKRADFKEEHFFILEAAEQIGFEPTNDDATEYRVTDEWLVEFVGRVRAPLDAANKRIGMLRRAIIAGDGS